MSFVYNRTRLCCLEFVFIQLLTCVLFIVCGNDLSRHCDFYPVYQNSYVNESVKRKLLIGVA